MQDQRQVGMVRNPRVRLKCDQQSAEAWFRSWERASATTADFCDAGGAGELAVKALFPHMQRWAYNLQASQLMHFVAASHLASRCCKTLLQVGSASRFK